MFKLQLVLAKCGLCLALFGSTARLARQQRRALHDFANRLPPLKSNHDHELTTNHFRDARNIFMAVLSLPLTFGNSFWSQDYRRGLEVLYGKLEQVRAAPAQHPLILLTLDCSGHCRE